MKVVPCGESCDAPRLLTRWGPGLGVQMLPKAPWDQHTQPWAAPVLVGLAQEGLWAQSFPFPTQAQEKITTNHASCFAFYLFQLFIVCSFLRFCVACSSLHSLTFFF